MLSTHPNLPPVAKTAVCSDLLQTLDIITVLGRNVLCEDLRVLSGLEVLLPVEEPERNLELAGVLNDSNNLFNLIGRQFSSALVNINFGLFANQIGKARTDTGNLGESKDNVALSFHVGIENTQNVLEFRSLHQRGRPELTKENVKE